MTKRLLFIVISIGLGFLVPLAAGELVLRFLPVYSGMGKQPVDEDNPIFHFKPNSTFLYSKGWKLERPNRGRINNYGFVNDQDYSPDSDQPLMAIIGDSYIEAAMLPFAETLSGRLAARVEGKGRVYSFAASGAPLSQYLAWAEYSSREFQPETIVVFIVGNDFDESLRDLKHLAAGFHYFDEQDDGSFKLKRTDFHRSWLREAVRWSALARYILVNVGGLAGRGRLIELFDWSRGQKNEYVGNTSKYKDAQVVRKSLAIIDAFLDEFPKRTGLPPSRISFVIDGIRPALYEGPIQLAAADASYFGKMRRAIMAGARSRGFEVIDMQPIFLDHYAQNGRRFEYAYDYHWNALAHMVIAETIVSSRVFLLTFGG